MAQIPMIWMHGLYPPVYVVPNKNTLTEGQLEDIVMEHPLCDFCEDKTTGSSYDVLSQGKRWNICNSGKCWAAAANQRERVYAGLIDSLQTRKDVLRWTNERNGKKK